MKIELKKIDYNERLSEETNAFSADLYINGKKAGVASNAGHGGPTDYRPYDQAGSALIKQAEEWCLTLPPKTYPAEGGFGPFAHEMNLEHYIDDLLGDHLKKLFQRKMQRYFKQHLVISDNPAIGFKTIRLSHPIHDMVKVQNGRNFLIGLISQWKDEGKPGEKILNDNIPQEIFTAAGLKEEQYVKPDQSNTVVVKQKKGAKRKL